MAKTTRDRLIIVVCAIVAAGLLVTAVRRQQNRQARVRNQRELTSHRQSAERPRIGRSTTLAASSTPGLQPRTLTANRGTSTSSSSVPNTSATLAQSPGSSEDMPWKDRVEKLGDQLRHNPDMIGSLMETISTETDPEMLSMLAEVVFHNGDVLASKLPVQQLLKMAKSDPVEARRAAALRMLAAVANVTPEIIRAVSDIAQSDRSLDMRVSAIGTTSFWVNRHPELREQLFHELLQTRNASEDPTVRGLSIQTIALQDAPLKGETLNAMIDALRTEKVTDNKALAALGLSGAAGPDTRALIVGELAAAFERESDTTFKRQMMVDIVRAAGAESPEYLKKLKVDTDPLLAQDYLDYLEILAQEPGATYERIWDAKVARDSARGTVIGDTGKSEEL